MVQTGAVIRVADMAYPLALLRTHPAPSHPFDTGESSTGHQCLLAHLIFGLSVALPLSTVKHLLNFIRHVYNVQR